MSGGISASPSSLFLPPPPQHKINTSRCSSSSSFSLVVPNYHPVPKLRSFHSSSHLKLRILPGGEFARPQLVVKCSSHNIPGGDDNGSKSVLDAFFLGKALAEAINERIESTVGELLSTVGRLQAEQQKQVQDFQEEVLERAKKAKEKAAREAMEAQGNILNESTTEVVAVEISPSSPSEQINNTNNNDPLLGMLIDDD